jgi:simple sugar transport system ATP-binding protein
MAEALLRLTGITKRYPAVVANDGVDLEVPPGQIHAVLGENGAGKSTLMKVIYGSVTPDSGTIAWRGRPVTIRSPAEARALGIGMVHQHFSLFDTLTAVENVSLAVPGSQSELARRITDAAYRFGLAVDPHAPVQAMSVGERQRIEILRCILQEPRLLIMDEPTSVLPPQGVARLFETLRALAKDGVGILFISHKLEEIRSLCDVATVMRGGRVAGVVDPKRESARTLTRLMIGRDIAPPVRAAAAEPGAPMLEIDGLDMPGDHPFATSLKAVRLTLRAGEITGVAGVSGNGQDALTRALSGERPLSGRDSGRIRLDGAPIGALGPGARRKAGLHFIPEERLGRGAVPLHTLSENAALTAWQGGLARWGFLRLGARRKMADDTIAGMDVRCGGAEATAQSLSGGNLQKYIVGRELASRPKVLIAAQPTWGVDVGAAAEIRRRLVALKETGAAVLVISEELEELFEVCDRLVVMFRGRVSAPVDAAATDIDHVGLAMAGDFDALESAADPVAAHA